MKKIIQNVFMLFILAIVLVSLTACRKKDDTTRSVDTEEDFKIIWVEMSIENEIRTILGKFDGDIMQSDLDTVTQLELSGQGILKLDDIAHFNKLTHLNLQNNDISDISPLSGLTSLISLNLGANDVSDIGSLSGLTNLTLLKLELTDVSNLTPLS